LTRKAHQSVLNYNSTKKLILIKRIKNKKTRN